MASSLLASRRNKLIVLGNWLLWTNLHAYVLHEWGLSWDISSIDATINNSVLLVGCILLIANLHYYRPRKGLLPYLLLICSALSALTMCAAYYILKSALAHDPQYMNILEHSKGVRFSIALLMTGGVALVSELWYTLEEQKEQEKRKADAEKMARDAELYQLRQQLQPHFLFNSLNSISALVSFKPAEARRMIQQLSDFLRGTLRKEEQQWISLADEMKHLQLYLDIEKVRFGHRLQTVITEEEGTASLQIPHMLLQPVVENAIKFGLYDTIGEVEIRIQASLQQHMLVLTVQNPLDQATAAPQSGTGFGLHSAGRRLYLLFGRHDLLTTSIADNIFTTTIKIPQA
jgi:sensor histidine kinase YesM